MKIVDSRMGGEISSAIYRFDFEINLNKHVNISLKHADLRAFIEIHLSDVVSSETLDIWMNMVDSCLLRSIHSDIINLCRYHMKKDDDNFDFYDEYGIEEDSSRNRFDDNPLKFKQSVVDSIHKMIADERPYLRRGSLFSSDRQWVIEQDVIQSVSDGWICQIDAKGIETLKKEAASYIEKNLLETFTYLSEDLAKYENKPVYSLEFYHTVVLDKAKALLADDSATFDDYKTWAQAYIPHSADFTL